MKTKKPGEPGLKTKNLYPFGTNWRAKRMDRPPTKWEIFNIRVSLYVFLPACILELFVLVPTGDIYDNKFPGGIINVLWSGSLVWLLLMGLLWGIGDAFEDKRSTPKSIARKIKGKK